MTDNEKKILEYKKLLESQLFDNIIPFWTKNSVDKEYGGFITWLDTDGSILSTDKSGWMQGRGTWIYSKLINQFGENKEWLAVAKNGFEFLKNKVVDSDGRCFFRLTREGKPIHKRRYLFTECFATIAFAEYFLATGNEEAKGLAIEMFKLIVNHIDNPEKLPSKYYTENFDMKSHAMPMIMISITQIVRKLDFDFDFDGYINKYIDELFSDFIHEDKKALFENVSPNGEFIDTPEGRCLNPGHTIETAWFLLKEGKAQKRDDIIDKALKVLEWSLEKGWDKEFGGILYFVDIKGLQPAQLEWDMKLWWPHNEAMIATMLAYSITKEQKYFNWFEKIYNWAIPRFYDELNGGWYGYMHRDGTIASSVKGSMWKGPFHVPRMYITLLDIIKDME